MIQTRFSSTRACKRETSLTLPLSTLKVGTVWVVGEYDSVKWNTSCPPPTLPTQAGMILLHDNGINTGDELASGFGIMAGSVMIPVPDVPPDNSPLFCKLLLLGLMDGSGNDSPAFTILAE
ncbi:hypothetical protein BU15DRAFT_61125 [Melanogaster broomeanus]|nr:hypothetical protein BU15DRAFT_61125 [Melanogaster broomeanus]